jgi:hypothetical protein
MEPSSEEEASREPSGEQAREVMKEEWAEK